MLIISYNRPDFLLQQIQNCKKENRQFLLSVDGPKGDSDRGANECASIARNVDRGNPLALGIRVGEENLGCRLGVATAISWAFGYSEKIIILEDDVTISEHFFPFMDFCLNEFRHSEEVFLINGWNPLSGYLSRENTFYLSRFFSPWGWATWRNRWELFDLELKSFSLQGDIRDLPTLRQYNLNPQFAKLYRKKLSECLSGYDTWDYQLLFSMWLNGKFSIMPIQRLTGNIGFDERATHTRKKLSFINPTIFIAPENFKNSVGRFVQLTDRNLCVNLDHEIDFLLHNFRSEGNLKVQAWNLMRRINEKINV